MTFAMPDCSPLDTKICSIKGIKDNNKYSVPHQVLVSDVAKISYVKNGEKNRESLFTL